MNHVLSEDEMKSRARMVALRSRITDAIYKFSEEEDIAYSELLTVLCEICTSWAQLNWVEDFKRPSNDAASLVEV